MQADRLRPFRGAQPWLTNTESQAATEFLTRDILSGVLPPNSKLKARDLSVRYDIGTTPLREALCQLAGCGLVERLGQRGFRVPPVAREHLLEITHTRQMVEAEAFRLAIEYGNRAWEDEISASLVVLRRVFERREQTETWLNYYDDTHLRFHRALIAACPLATLREFCDKLCEQKARYRRILRSLGHPRDGVIAMHERLAQSALDRDAAGGMGEIAAHIGSNTNTLLPILGQPGERHSAQRRGEKIKYRRHLVTL